MSQQNRHFFEFGPFRIDTINRQLVRDGLVVPLKAKAVDTLLLLIENRGDVVEKDDLMKSLWPDSFVEESNLTQNIYTLRKALGEFDYIETIPRRGYRFVAHVKESDGADLILIKEKTRTSLSYEETDEPQLTPATRAALLIDVSAKARTSSHRWLWLSVASTGALLVIVGAILLLRSPQIPFASVKLTKFTTTGKAVRAAVSPDGKYVAYAASNSGQQSVWLRQMATGKELQIVAPHATDIYGLTFTHDGSYVFYVSQAQNHLGMLYRVPSLGGAPDKLIEDVDSPVTFSPDDKQMAFIRFAPGMASIVIANVDGSSERALVTTQTKDAVRIGPNGVLPPSWSPDGKTIACPVSINSSQWNQAIFAFDVENGSSQRMTMNDWPALGRVEWLPDGSGILVTVIESETSADQQIWFVPYPKGTARRITNDLTDYRDISVTGDGRMLVTIQSERKANIWLASTNDLDHPKQLTTTSYDGLNGLSWTPDGKIVYTSWISGEQNLWITDLNGDTPKQLTEHAGFNEQPVVSPDGRYIVFLSNRDGDEHLWRIDLNGKHPLKLTHGFGDKQPSFTADGQAVIFNSRIASGTSLFRVSIDGGEPVRLTEKISFDPNVSPDGKSIACSFRPEPSKTKIAILSLSGSEPKLICDQPAYFGRLRWASDGTGLAYAAKQEGVGNIWLQPLDGSPAKQLTHWNTNPIFSFGWSRDGKWLAYANGSLTSDVVMITDISR